MPRLSYSQNGEDVLLWRTLGDVDKGFYLDIGAFDPDYDSVSRMFYDAGWRGMHVEPVHGYAEKLRAARADEVVLESCVGAAAGLVEFFEIPGTGLSTISTDIAGKHEGKGWDIVPRTVPMVTLAQLFDRCPADIHWLKIDVEAAERQVLEGWGDHPARPWVVVIESTEPSSSVETHQEWAELIEAKGYACVYFDGLNRYFLAEDHRDLERHFVVPINIFDDYKLPEGHVRIDYLTDQWSGRLDGLEGDLQAARQAEERLRDDLDNANALYQQSLAKEHARLTDALRSFSEREGHLTQALADERLAAADAIRRDQDERDRQVTALATLGRQLDLARSVANGREAVLVQQLASAKEMEGNRAKAFEQRIADLSRHLQESAASLLAAEARAVEERQRAERSAILARTDAEQERSANALIVAALERTVEDSRTALLALKEERELVLGHLRAERDAALAERDAETVQHEGEIAGLKAQHDLALNDLRRQHESLLVERQGQVDRRDGEIAVLLAMVERSRARIAHIKHCLDVAAASPFRLFFARSQVFRSALATADQEFADDIVATNPQGTGPASQPDMLSHRIMENEQPMDVMSQPTTLAALLALNDTAFVRASYLALLNRAPDPEGASHSVRRLRQGIGKVQILCELRSSAEGRVQAVDLPGLGRHLFYYRWRKIPLLGLLLSRRSGIGNMSEDVTILRRMEARMDWQGERLLAELGKTTAAVVSEADAVRRYVEHVGLAARETVSLAEPGRDASAPPPVNTRDELEVAMARLVRSWTPVA